MTRRSTEYADLFTVFSTRAAAEADPDKRSEYTDLAERCSSISSQITDLGQQFERDDQLLTILQVDMNSMIEYYSSSQQSLQSAIANLAKLSTDLKNYDREDDISKLLRDRFVEVVYSFQPISLAVLLSNFGKCGHLAYIYDTISYALYFAAVR